MDSIVEGVDQFIEELAEYAVSLIAVIGMAIIFLTTPVWILPYKAIRGQLKKMNERQEKEDAGNND